MFFEFAHHDQLVLEVWPDGGQVRQEGQQAGLHQGLEGIEICVRLGAKLKICTTRT